MLAPGGIIHPFRDDLRDDYVPECWTAEHVERRLVEAYRTLRQLPGGYLRPRQFGNSWPGYASEWADLLARLELTEDDPFRAMRIPDRPSARQIAEMDKALSWAGSYLRGYPDQAKAASRRAMAKALDVPLAVIARRLRTNARRLKRTAYAGYDLIARQLNRAFVGTW